MERTAFRFSVVDDPAALAAHLAAWDELAGEALEPNAFYEPWMLIPAIEAFGRDTELRFVFVYADRLLCGMFPLERAPRYRGLPFQHLKLWRHKHCYLGTPLLRRSHAHACLGAFLDWLAADPRGAGAIEWDQVAGDGAFFQVLSEVLQRTRRRSFASQRFSRALLQPRADGEAFIGEALSPKHRKELKRLERRLAELGPIEYTALEPGADPESWIAQFLDLEASGWKSRRASALGASDAGQHFFTRSAAEAARRGRLMMLALKLAGRPIAMKCNFLAEDGAYTFKIAYDEEYARFSPGVLLELDNIRRAHTMPGLRWMDSCASADHFMANRLWLDRRSLVTLITATGRRAAASLAVSSLPLLYWIARSLRNEIPGTGQRGVPLAVR